MPTKNLAVVVVANSHSQFVSNLGDVIIDILYTFEQMWSRLAEHAHLIAIDLPGFGHSDRQDELLTSSARLVHRYLVARGRWAKLVGQISHAYGK